MQQLAQLSSSERAEVFTETASVLGMTPVIVEKDYWVSWALCGLFNDELLASKLMFKPRILSWTGYRVLLWWRRARRNCAEWPFPFK